MPNKKSQGIFFLVTCLCLLVLLTREARADIIIDNGGPGTSYTGTWPVSGGTSSYGSNSLWSRDGATYSWKFSSQPAGTYEVSMWWSALSSRATNIAVQIISADGIKTVYINQQTNAGKWNSLGQYNFGTSGSVKIIAAAGSTVSTCADAVKFTPVSAPPPDPGSDIIIDNGKSGTSYTGSWPISSGTSPYGANSLWSRDGTTYTWQTSLPSPGTYEVFMWWSALSSRATSIAVQISTADGIKTVYINQQMNAGNWNSLGQYNFGAGGSVKILAAAGSTVSTCADAVKFTYIPGGNMPPNAVIDSVTPNPVLPEKTVTFTGHGNDSDGTITAYNWRSDKDGFLSDKALYSTSALSAGVHTIFFKVQDDKGAWSTEVSNVVYRLGCDAPVRIMPIGDSITYGMGEISDQGLITGYRRPLHQLLLGSGYDIDFVGAIQTGQSASPVFDIDHQGTPGITAEETASNVFSYLSAHPADIILLHIGTNALGTDPSDVGKILDEIERSSPQTIVILARIINQKPLLSTVTVFNDNVQAMALTRIAQGDKIILVDQEHALTYPDDIWDAVHPRNSGYEKMAAVWFNELNKILPVCGQFGPFIYTYPFTHGTMAEPYSYQIGATGDPMPAFSLTQAPPGMTLDSTNGLITWTPYASGSFDVTAEAYNGTGNPSMQTFSINVGTTGGVIIDDGDPQTSYTDSWHPSSASGYYGSGSVWSRDGSTYTWAFTPATSGNYELSMWWTDWPSRSASVPVDISYSGGKTRLYINQQQNGAQWNVLGSYSFSAGLNYMVTITAQPGPSSTCADAVRFIRVQ